MPERQRIGVGPRAVWSLSIAVLGLVVFGCASSSGGGGGAGGEAGAGGIAPSILRVAHLAVAVPEADAARLDFTVVDQGSFNDIAFGRASGRATLAAGTHRVDATEPGGGPPLASVTWELEPEGRYTVVAYRNSGEAISTGLIVFDEGTEGLEAGRGRIVIGHGADDSTWATVDVVDSDASEVLATGLVLGGQTAPIDLAAGPRELGFSVSSVPPVIDEGPFPVDVSTGETTVLLVVDGDLVDASVDATVYILEPNTTGMIPAIPLE